MRVRVGVSERREQVQLICVPQTRVPGKISSALSGFPGSLRGREWGPPPPGLRLQVSKGRGPAGFLQVPQTQVSGPGKVFVTLGPIWAGLAQRGPRVGGVGDRAEGPEMRGAATPGAGRAGAARLPPAPLPAVPRGPRPHSPRSGPRAAGRAALGLRQALSGPGSGGGRAIVRCILGAARAGVLPVEGAVPRALYGPACPPARAAGAARGRRAGADGSGADARALPSLPASEPRSALALGPIWEPPRGHRRPCRRVCLSCCCFCRSRGCPWAPGTRRVTCSTAHAWVRPPEPSVQMGKLRPREEKQFL